MAPCEIGGRCFLVRTRQRRASKVHHGMVKAIPFINIRSKGRRGQSKEMEAEKRKNKENDIVSGPMPKKARDQDAGETTVNDDEVEEFYAILRRIHAAVTYFEKGTADGRRLPVKGSKWRQGLEKEILEEVKGAGSEKLKRTEDVEEKVGFDLNVNPGSDDDAVQMDFI